MASNLGPKLLPPLSTPHRVSKFRQRWVLSAGLISSIPPSPPPISPETHAKSHLWGGGKWAKLPDEAAAEEGWNIPVEVLNSQTSWPAPSRASPPLPAFLAAAPSNQAVGSSSAWGSLHPPGLCASSRHLCRGWGSGVLFSPLPSLPLTTSERRVKVGLAGGEEPGRGLGDASEEGRHFGGAGRLPEAGTHGRRGHWRSYERPTYA